MALMLLASLLLVAQPAPAVAVPAAAPTPIAAPADPAPAAPETTAPAPAPKAAHAASPPEDPFEKVNRVSYAISQPIDRFLIRPVALGYKAVVPKPGRDGIRNFLANLFEPVVFMNDAVQLRPKRALHTTLRFLINSTIGIGGLLDMAKRKPFHLPDHPNGFADTLGYYGLPPGPYFYLPVIGPGSLRDIAGFAGDWFAQPRLLGKMANPDNDKSFFHSSLKIGTVGTAVVATGAIGQRADHDDELEALKAQSVDPYAALRSSWLQDRAAELAEVKAKDGAPAQVPAFTDPLDDPAAAPAAPPATPAPPAPTPSAPAP